MDFYLVADLFYIFQQPSNGEFSTITQDKELKISHGFNNLKIHDVEQQKAPKGCGYQKKRLADGDFLRQEAHAFRYFAAAWAIPRHLSHEA